MFINCIVLFSPCIFPKYCDCAKYMYMMIIKRIQVSVQTKTLNIGAIKLRNYMKHSLGTLVASTFSRAF